MDSYQGIGNLLARYSQVVDAGDFDGVGAHLAHCTLSSGAWPGVAAAS